MGHLYAAIGAVSGAFLGRMAAGRGRSGIRSSSQLNTSRGFWPKERSAAVVPSAGSLTYFEREYHPEFLGEYAARQESSRRLYALAGLALVGIVLLIYVDFQSARLTLLVFLTVPFALTGGVFAVLLGGACRWAPWSASSRCWASRPATAS